MASTNRQFAFKFKLDTANIQAQAGKAVSGLSAIGKALNALTNSFSKAQKASTGKVPFTMGIDQEKRKRDLSGIDLTELKKKVKAARASSDEAVGIVTNANKRVEKALKQSAQVVKNTSKTSQTEEQKSAKATEKATKDKERSLKARDRAFTVSIDHLKRNINEFLNATSRMANGIRQGFQGVSEIARTVALSIAAPIGALLFDAGRFAIEFETQWAKTSKALANTPTDVVATLQQKLKDLAKITPTAVTDLAMFAEQAGQMGIESGPAVLRFVNLINKAAIGTDVVAGSIAEDIGRIAAAFGQNLNFEEGMVWAESLVSVMDTVAKATSTNMAGIITAIKDAATIGPLLKIEAKEVATSVGILINAGLDPSGAGTVLQRFYVQIVKHAEEFSSMMKNFGRVTTDAKEPLMGLYDTAEMAMQQINDSPTQVLIDVLTALKNTPDESRVKMLSQFFESTGLVGARVGAGQASVERFQEILDLVNQDWETGATLQADYVRMLQTTESQQKVFTNNVHDTGMVFAEYLLPYFNKLMALAIPAIRELGKWFSGLAEWQKMLAVALPILAVVAAPVLFVISSLAHGFSLLAVSTLTFTTGLVNNLFLAFKTIATLAKGIGLLSTPIGILFAVAAAGIGVLIASGVNVADFFMGLADKAEQWGEDLLTKYASGLGHAAGVVVSILAKLAKMISGFFGGKSSSIKVDVGGTKFGGGRADGGKIQKGKTYLTGEEGPELITAGSDGNVIPNDALPSSGSGWGSKLVTSYASGISGAASSVGKAIGIVTKKVADYLEAHSPPRKGVLSSIEEWGTNIMRTYLEGFALADFDILSDVGNKIRSVFELMEGLGQIEEGSWLDGLLEAKTAISNIIDIFNQTGQVAEDVLSSIGSNMGAIGTDIQELVRRWLAYKKIQQEIKALEVQKKQTLKTYDAEIARISKLNISAEEKAALMREQMMLRDEELRQIEEAKLEKEESAEVAKEELDWQQAFIDAQLETLSIFKEMNKEKESGSGSGGADDDFGDAINFNPTIDSPDGTPITEWITEMNSFTERIGAAQKAWEAFKLGLMGGAKPVSASDMMAQGVPGHIASQVGADQTSVDMYNFGSKLSGAWTTINDIWDKAEPKIKSIQESIQSISDNTEPLFGFLGTTIPEQTSTAAPAMDVAPLLEMLRVVEPLERAFYAINSALTGAGEKLGAAFGTSAITPMMVFEGIVLVLAGTIITLINGIATLVSWFAVGIGQGITAATNFFLGFGQVVQGLYQMIFGDWSQRLDGLQMFLSGLATILASGVQYLTAMFTNLVMALGMTAAGMFGDLVAMIIAIIAGPEAAKKWSDAFSGVTGFIERWFDSLLGTVENVKNDILDFIGMIVDGIRGIRLPDLPSWLGGGSNGGGSGSPTNNAKGGLAIGPHIGRFGEAGPEALLPLDKIPSLLWDVAGEGMGGNGMSVTFSGDIHVRNDNDIDLIVDKLAKKLGKKRDVASRMGNR
jgi:TP901 family phage tail tape measure protein